VAQPSNTPDFARALEAYEQWLKSDINIFEVNGGTLKDRSGKTEFISQSDCQKLADHGLAIRGALRMAIEASVPAEPKPGDKMFDGSVYAGISPDTNKPMYAMPADAPLSMTFNEAKKYAQGANAQRHYGHDGWHVPTKAELNVLFNNRAAIGGFNTTESASDPAGWYWSAKSYTWTAWGQRFSDGCQGNPDKGNHSSVRLVC